MASDIPTFTTAELFGGAITASIPSTFLDASTLRQIPDNQEVFVDREGTASITFDILEKIDTNDSEKAIAIHLGEVVEGDPAEVVDMGAGEQLESMPEIPVHSVLAIVKSGSQTHDSRRVDFTAIVMMLVRLEKVKTDFVVFVNVPHAQGEYSPDEVNIAEKKWGPLIERAGFVREEIRKTLKVADWGLFGEEVEHAEHK